MANETTVTTSVRWSPVLRDRLQAAATRERRSVNNLLIVIVEEWLDAHEPGNGSSPGG